MPISDSAKIELITLLKNANVIHLIDDDYYTEMDHEGNQVSHEAKEMARVSFEKNIELQRNALRNFKSEFINNKYIKGFNVILYIEDLEKECESILGIIKELTFNKQKLLFRSDTIFKHYIIGEEETIIDNSGEITHLLKPKIIKIQLDSLEANILNSISKYYESQKKLLTQILDYINEEVEPIEKQTNYGTTYSFNYFKFDISRIGEENLANTNIQDFFNELIDKDFVEEGSLKSLLDFFNNRGSKNKVVWLKTKSELWYLIKSMVKRKFLVNPKRQTALIIAKIFVSHSGKSFEPKNFKSLHKPKNTGVIDDLLGILG